jgi:hypothetical protein
MPRPINVRNESSGPGLLVLSEHGSVTATSMHDAVVNGTISGDLSVGHSRAAPRACVRT